MVDGVVYRSRRQAYDILKPKVSFQGLVARLRYDWSNEEAFELVVRHEQPQLVVNGVAYQSQQKAYDTLNPVASFNTVRGRLRRGWSNEEAFEVVTRKKKKRVGKKSCDNQSKTYHVDGHTYNSIAELARAYDLSYSAVQSRIRSGWELKRAVATPIRDGAGTVTVDGVQYVNALQAFEKIGRVSTTVFQGRKAKGHTLKVCLGLEPIPVKERYELFGKTYLTLEDVVIDYGLSFTQLYGRLRRNMSLEEAVHHSPPKNGRYSQMIFDKDSDLADHIGCLYFVKIEFDKDTLHKVGITKNDVDHRLRHYSYDYTVICTFQGRLEDLYTIEQTTLITFQEFHHRADEDFEGRTETLSLNEKDESAIVRFLNKQFGR